MRGCVRIACVILVEMAGQKLSQWPFRLRCSVEIDGDRSWWGHDVISKRLGSLGVGSLVPDRATTASKIWRMSAPLRRLGRWSTWESEHSAERWAAGGARRRVGERTPGATSREACAA